LGITKFAKIFKKSSCQADHYSIYISVKFFHEELLFTFFKTN